MATSSPASPLRYPGGKQSLAPFVRALIERNGIHGCVYAEPYAGGAGLALRLLMDGIVSQVLLNDKCSMLTTFWRTLFWNTDELLRRISETPINMDTWRKTRETSRNPSMFSDEDIAFALFFQNRTNFSGVIDGGVIGGKRQLGKYKLDARYPKTRLIDLIKKLSCYRDKVRIFNLDAITFMRNELLPMNTACLTYCDPPYYEKGQALYLNAYSPNDHAEVSDFLQSYSKKMRWIVSYDNASQIIALYNKAKLFSFNLSYSAHRVRKGKELLAVSKSLVMPDTDRCPISFLELN